MRPIHAFLRPPWRTRAYPGMTRAGFDGMRNTSVSVTPGSGTCAPQTPATYTPGKYLWPLLYLSDLHLYHGRSGGLRNPQGRYVADRQYAHGRLAELRLLGVLLFPYLPDHLGKRRGCRKCSWNVTSGDVQVQHSRAESRIQSGVDKRARRG